MEKEPSSQIVVEALVHSADPEIVLKVSKLVQSVSKLPAKKKGSSQVVLATLHCFTIYSHLRSRCEENPHHLPGQL